MLALPCNTVNNGFILSSVVFLICWFFMTISALFMLEATIWFKENVNLTTMVDQILGCFYRIITSFIYICLLYSLMSAYIFAYDKWLKKIFTNYIAIENMNIICIIIFIILNIIIVFKKKNIINKINYLLSIALLLIYICMIYICLPHIDIKLIKKINYENISNGLSLIITSFGFCVIIPTISVFLKKNKHQLIISIIIGSIIPLLVYIMWQFTILGIFPTDGKYSLVELSYQKENFDIMFIYFLEEILKISLVSKIILIFSLLAVLTSMIGISLSLVDFLYDNLNIKNNNNINKTIILSLIILPPIIISNYAPIGFTKILNLSGILVSFLLGILPTIIVWKGRYSLSIKSEFSVIGGKSLIIITNLFFVYIIFYELNII